MQKGSSAGSSEVLSDANLDVQKLRIPNMVNTDNYERLSLLLFAPALISSIDNWVFKSFCEIPNVCLNKNIW